jgi:alkanesulfonate monooxygenase SsuD/methylene tetrahydromethanopterin reductase-like flavin-dependent oxidoreductase (luciferase family)
VKLGILVEVEEGLDWDRCRQTYAAVEHLGFESVWLSDHLRSPWSADQRGLETWTALAVAAAETRTLRLGPLVSPITFRPASVVGCMTAALDQLAEGRFTLGLGLGWNADEHLAAGIDFPSVAERARRLDAGIVRIRSELGDRHVRVLVGGQGPRSTLPIVARHADEWNMTTGSATRFADASRQLDAACQAIGREPGTVRRSIATGVLVGRNADDLRARANRLRQCVPPLAQATDVLAAARAMGWLVGTCDQLVAALRELERAGAQRAILGHYDPRDTTLLEVLADGVLPSFR